MTAARRRLESRRRIAAMSPEELEQMRAQGIEQFKEDLSEAPGALAQGVGNFARFLTEDPERTTKLAGLFTDAGGIAEAFGYYPDPFNEGEFLPSVLEQAKEGDYLGAGLTTLGAIPLVGLFARGLKGARIVNDVIKYEKFGDSSVRLDADPFGDENTLLVNELTATEFRKGYGKGIMQDLIEQAEEQGKNLTLFPQQLDDITGGMDDEALVSFYKSLGFKTRFEPTDDTPYDSLPDLNKYLIYRPKTVKPMSEAQYNAAIGAARNDKALQQKLIAEKNELYPKKDKKKKEKTPEQTPRQIAAAASEGTDHQVGTVTKGRGTTLSGETEEVSDSFGFDGGDKNANSPYQQAPNLTRYNNAATRAVVKMKKPGQNISGDALLNRLELSAGAEDRTGIRSLIKEMGGLDDPNFIGADGKGATITYDQFVQRLTEYGPKRAVIRYSQPEYANLQELKYTDAEDFAKDADNYDGDFTLTPTFAPSFGADGESGISLPLHRFANLHVHNKNIKTKTKFGEQTRASTSHGHYTDMAGEIESRGVFDGVNQRDTQIIAHSRGGLYTMQNSSVASDNGHLTVGFDEFQIDGMSKQSKLKSEANPQRVLKEKSRLKTKLVDNQNKATEIGDAAIERFGGGNIKTAINSDDPFVKNFSTIFRYYSTEGQADGQKIADMLAMDTFIDDLGKPGQGVPTNPYTNQVDARKFWEKNFHTFFKKPEYDPSNPEFIAKYVQSKEGQEAFESNINGSFAALRDKGNFGGYTTFGERLAEYGKKYEQNPNDAVARDVIESISRIIGDTESTKTNRFKNAAFENGFTDALTEAGMEYANAASELETLEGSTGFYSKNIVDRQFVETAEKYGPVAEEIENLRSSRRNLDNIKKTHMDKRATMLNEKVRDFFSYASSMSKVDRNFAKANKENLRDLGRLREEIRDLENGGSNVGSSLKLSKASEFLAYLEKGLDRGTEVAGLDRADGGGMPSFDLLYDLERGKDHTLSLFLDADFSTLRGVAQVAERTLDIPASDFEVRTYRSGQVVLGSSSDKNRSFAFADQKELERQRELFERLQFRLRQLLGTDSDKISEAFQANGKLPNEQRTLAEIQAEQSKLLNSENELIKRTEAADPEFSEELVNQLDRSYNAIYDLPYESVKDSIRQVVQGDLANQFDGYLMQHMTPQSVKLSADDLMSPDNPSFGVPKFITIPSANKTMQTRGKTLSDPGGFAYQDSGRDDAIKQFIEDNPDFVEVRKDLKNTATRENGNLSKNDQNKDVVLEIKDDVRRKFAVAFAEANNTLLEKYTKEAVDKNFASVDEYIKQFNPKELAEILREDAMRIYKKNNLDGETYVRYAKGGEVNLHKGIGAMASVVL
tara:strand:+ start:3513 stop:7577 length:4065 start_codon:yes stop_codon:yes gene_type:complete